MSFMALDASQVPSVYVHNEHRDYPDHGDHNQLELSHPADASLRVIISNSLRLIAEMN